MKRKHSNKPVLEKKKRFCKSAKACAVLDEQREQARIVLQGSETRYRRLFESAQDGILILDAKTGCIDDVNPFLAKILGLPQKQILNKKLWEIGLFQDVEKSKSAFKDLQRNGYIRYEDMPLETKDGRRVDVEFVSNVYKANGINVIQCNIRDITERKRADVENAILETIEEEQRRIGQDLHDGLCQQLTGVALMAKALGQKLTGASPKESSDAFEIAELISRSIDQTRDLARGLSPLEISVAGLAPALQKLTSAIKRYYQISCEFDYDESTGFQCRYQAILATHLYRIAQEAINNAIKHGKAKQITVTLSVYKDYGCLSVQDNGSGFQVHNEEKPGLGLRSMRYRARMIKARLKIDDAPGGGTVVICTFPHTKKKDVVKI